MLRRNDSVALVAVLIGLATGGCSDDGSDSGGSSAGGGGGSAGSGGSNAGGSGGSAASSGAGGACAELGQACTDVCASGFSCESGVCAPAGRAICGGFAAAECPEAFPACIYCSGCDYGPCMTAAELECVCATAAGRRAFPGCS